MLTDPWKKTSPPLPPLPPSGPARDGRKVAAPLPPSPAFTTNVTLSISIHRIVPLWRGVTYRSTPIPDSLLRSEASDGHGEPHRFSPNGRYKNRPDNAGRFFYVPPSGFEPEIYALRRRRPKPLDDGGAPFSFNCIKLSLTPQQTSDKIISG